MKLCSGPVAAFEIERNTAIRAVNGLIPLFVGDAPWVVSTERAVVERLTGRRARLVPPGHQVSADEETVDVGDACADHTLLQPSRRVLGREARARIAHLGAMKTHNLPVVDLCGASWVPRVHEVIGTNDMLWLPDSRTIRGRAGIRRARAQLAPALWHRLDAAGRRLLVPCIERPAPTAIMEALTA
jgi:hypothetical protein